jgi:6-phosphogluconolactonase (cycloisomerase 2 family)
MHPKTISSIRRIIRAGCAAALLLGAFAASSCKSPVDHGHGKSRERADISLDFVISGNSAGLSIQKKGVGGNRLVLPTAIAIDIELEALDDPLAAPIVSSAEIPTGQDHAAVSLSSIPFGRYSLSAVARDAGGTGLFRQSSELELTAANASATLNLVPVDPDQVSAGDDGIIAFDLAPRSSRTWRLPANSKLFTGSAFIMNGIGAGSGCSVFIQALDGTLLAEQSEASQLATASFETDQESYLTLYHAGLDESTRAVTMYGGPNYAYTANNWVDTVSAFSVNPSDGSLSPIGTYGAGDGPNSITSDRQNRFLFVANNGTSSLSSYSINADGTLVPVANFPIGTAYADAVVIDPTGRFAYVACIGIPDGAVWAIAVADDGTLSGIGSYPLDRGTTALSVDPSGRFLYSVSAYEGNIRAFSIDSATGALTSIGSYPASPGPYGSCYLRAVAVHPSGRFAYAVHTPESSGQGVYIFPIDQATGTLGTPLIQAESDSPNSIAFSEDGKLAFIANSGGSGGYVESYTVDEATGALTSLGTVAAGDGATSPSLDGTGRNLYITNWNNANVMSLAIGPATGQLTMLPGGPYATGNGPQSIHMIRK